MKEYTHFEDLRNNIITRFLEMNRRNAPRCEYAVLHATIDRWSGVSSEDRDVIRKELNYLIGLI